MFSARIDAINDGTNIVHSWKGEKIKSNGVDKNVVIKSFLSGEVPEPTDLKERLEILLVRCFSFTSKLCNYDELTGTHDYGEDMCCTVLTGSDAISDHHCAGSIQYNKSSVEYLNYLEIMLWNKYNVIVNHTLKNMEINILRSSGIKQKGYIGDRSIRWSKTQNEFIIKVSIENNTFEKHIDLGKVLELNPEVKIQVKLPIINNLPDWVNEEYLEWKKFIHLHNSHFKIIEG